MTMRETTSHPPASARTRFQLVRFLGISLGLHLGAVVAVSGISYKLRIPTPEITWLDLDNTLGAPRANKKVAPPPRPAPAPVPAASAPLAALAPKPAPKPRPKPKPDAGPPAMPQEPFTTDKLALTELAAGDAALMLLLRMDRIRSSPYVREVRRLLEVFYDHKTLLWSSGLDPMNDFEALLIATPNPYRVTQTLLVVRHKLPPLELRQALTRAGSYGDQRLRWFRREDGWKGVIPSPPRLPTDQRVVVLRRDLVLLMDPSLMPLLDEAQPASGEGSPSGTAPDAGVPPQTWSQRLAAMESTGGPGDKGPGLLLQGINLPRLIRLPPDIPVPLTLRVAVEAMDPTKPEALLTFASEADAVTFLEQLPRRLDQARGSWVLRLLGVTDLLQAIRFERTQATVRATVELSGSQLRALLELMRNAIPQVPVPGLNQNRIPDAGRLPDAGRPSPPSAPARSEPDARPPSTIMPPDARTAPAASPPPTAVPPDARSAPAVLPPDARVGPPRPLTGS